MGSLCPEGAGRSTALGAGEYYGIRRDRLLPEWNLALQGRRAKAREVFERLLAVRNDVGLLSEEYEPTARRLAGNFPRRSAT